MPRYRVKCIFCGDELDYDTASSLCAMTYKPRCRKEECLKKAEEYSKKRDAFISEFENDKERVLKPLKGKLDTELFLLERESFKEVK